VVMMVVVGWVVGRRDGGRNVDFAGDYLLTRLLITDYTWQ